MAEMTDLELARQWLAKGLKEAMMVDIYQRPDIVYKQIATVLIQAQLDEARREKHDEYCENAPIEDCACRKRRIAALEAAAKEGGRGHG